MPLYDAKGREVEAGYEVWLTKLACEPYTAFRERPEGTDVRSLLADELPPQQRSRGR